MQRLAELCLHFQIAHVHKFVFILSAPDYFDNDGVPSVKVSFSSDKEACVMGHYLETNDVTNAGKLLT